jgi:hypothetical protein
MTILKVIRRLVTALPQRALKPSMNDEASAWVML